ncbi:MAG: DUF72 domain-containing protein [Bacteroidota bacterium]|nr:DUF72 domain-containing protein [Bacteroidota bacterium]
MSGQFYGGTSGLQIALPKRDFPPEHQHLSRLGFYAQHEDSIEINSSFYKLPQAKTVARWVSEVPVNFRFTFKLWKHITHQRNLVFNSIDIDRFMEVLTAANEHRGCLLVQFPPSLHAGAQSQLHELLRILDSTDWPVAVEFRHPSWYKDSVFELLNSYRAAMVIQDMPKSAAPLELTADDLVYLRFHGPSGNYKGSYSDSFLYEYANYIHEWLAEDKKVFAYFNNTAGSALQNLHLLKDYIDQLSRG